MVDGVEWDKDVFNFFWTGVPGSCFTLFDFPMGDLRPCSVLVDFLFFAPADEDVFFFLQTGVGGFRAVFIDFLIGAPGPSSISFALLLLARPPSAPCFGFLLWRSVDVFCGTNFFCFFATPPESGGTVNVVGGADFFFFCATPPDSGTVDVVGSADFFFSKASEASCAVFALKKNEWLIGI